MVNEQVLAATFRGNEPNPLFLIEPFDGSDSHTDTPSFVEKVKRFEQNRERIGSNGRAEVVELSASQVHLGREGSLGCLLYMVLIRILNHKAGEYADEIRFVKRVHGRGRGRKRRCAPRLDWQGTDL